MSKRIYKRIFRSLRLARKAWAGLFTNNGYPTGYPLVRGRFHYHLIRKVMQREGLNPSREYIEKIFVMFGEYDFRWF